jgi:oxalate decarboxylase/phosphoglucose isomerase-like protein (cupin superfamily)
MMNEKQLVFRSSFIIPHSSFAFMSDDTQSTADRRVSLADALSRLPGPDGKPFAVVFEHGTLSVEIFAPRGADTQQPHSRDEVYVVARGRGEFLSDGARQHVAAGDFLFVPARVPHRFENFSDDFAVWVFFYGPEGGERGSGR